MLTRVWKRIVGRVPASRAACTLVAVMVCVPAVSAQITPVDEPTYVAVRAETATVEPIEGGELYDIAQLRQGTVLRVLGFGKKWVRVEYLPGWPAYVPADEVQVAADGTAVTLIQDSKLDAFNREGGRSGHYWDLLDTALPAGTQLPVQRTVTGEAGSIFGYVVDAPKGAYGYIAIDAVRPARASEIRAFELEHGTASTTPAQTPGAEPPATQDQTATPISSQDNAEQTGSQTTAIDQPTRGRAQDPTPAPRPVRTADPSGVTGTVQALAQMYERVQAQDVMQAEFGAAIAEFRRTIDSLDNTRAGAAVRSFLQDRLDVLETRATLQETLLAAEQRKRSIQESAQRTADLDRTARARQGYSLVGRLMASTVYDGKRGLPLMFKVESPGATGRTLGYVVATEDVQVQRYLGSLVGVVGNTRYDESLNLHVVAAERIDTLVAPGSATNSRDTPNPSPADRPAEDVEITEVDVTEVDPSAP